MRDRLRVELVITVAGKPYKVLGGALRSLDLDLTSHGVEGSVEFVALDDSAHDGPHTDAFFAACQLPDLAEIHLTVRGVYSDRTLRSALPTLETRALVIGRSIREQVFTDWLASPAVLVRHYRLRFADRARTLWTQHFPVSLYTNRTLREVFDAERGSIELSYDWSALNASRPQVFLGLDADREVSFYDALWWMLSRERGHLIFDHAAGTYALRGAKPEPPAPGSLAPIDVASSEITLAEPRRSKTRIVNVDAAQGARHEVDAPQAATGVYSDRLVRTSIAQQVDDRVATESKVGTSDPRTLRVELARLPDGASGPGAALKMPAAAGFSAELSATAATWRVFAARARIRSLAETTDEHYGEADAGFDLTVALELETSTHDPLRAPAFRAPAPLSYVEGTVLSAIGEAADLTYESKQAEVTAIEQYRVEIALFDKQEVHPFYEPELASGTFYLPYYKSAKVLLAMEFDRCRITRSLDWRPGARLAQDGQGQQLFLGKSEKSNTHLRNAYEGDAPVFEVLRTNGNDTLLVRLEEGKMTLRVRQTEGDGAA